MNDAAVIDRRLHERYVDLYAAEAVRFLETRATEEIAAILGPLPPVKHARILERMSPDIATQVLSTLDNDVAVATLDRMNPVHGAAILSGVDSELRTALMQSVKPSVARDLEHSMSYPPDSAGALMHTQILYFRPDMTVRETLVMLRRRYRGGFRLIFIVDAQNRLRGMVEIQTLALSNGNMRLSELQRDVSAVVTTITSKDEIVETFEKTRVTDLPVVDMDGAFMGIIPYHALVEAAREESSADLLTMVGASKDERALSKASFAIRKRLPWLQINLVTAFMAAAVVGLFEDTIAKFTALAVLLPVVAGQSGNTGAQALAVTMRGLALREVRPGLWPRVVFKEINVGFWNGVAIAATTALGVFVWSGSPGLCLIIAISMVISMTIAGIAGAAIPIILTVVGQDPAQSSSIFLTTVTDIVGFFSFLGIATALSSLLT